MSNPVELAIELQAQEDEKGTQYILKGIPADVFRAVRNKAKELAPDKGENAWAWLLLGLLQSITAAGSDTLLLTRIPEDYSNALKEALSHVDNTPENLLKSFYQQAYDGNFRLIDFLKEGETPTDVTTLVILNFPNTILKIYKDLLEILNGRLRADKVTPLSSVNDLIALLLLQAPHNMTFSGERKTSKGNVVSKV